MERFGQNGFRDELDGSKIHRLSNILTLDHRLHTFFDKLTLWLEGDDVSRDETCESYSDLQLYRRCLIPTAFAPNTKI